MIQVTVTDTGVHAGLAQLLQRMTNPRAGLREIGKLMTEFTKTRFEVSQDPYGVPWAPNKPSTLESLLGRHPKNRTNQQRGAWIETAARRAPDPEQTGFAPQQRGARAFLGAQVCARLTFSLRGHSDLLDLLSSDHGTRILTVRDVRGFLGG